MPPEKELLLHSNITDMKKIIIFFTAIAITFSAQNASSQVLFDTGRPAKLIQLGVRMGFNSSNLSTNYDDITPGLVWNHTQWKNGFNAGFVADINFTNFFAIQPGIFFKSRNNDYHYLVRNEGNLTAIEGNWGGKYFEIPILASLRLGVAELAQLQVDFGPYFATGFGGKVKSTVFTTAPTDYLDSNTASYQSKGDYFGDKGLVKRYDWGFKMGVGFLLMQHYYIGAHYSAGSRNVLQEIVTEAGTWEANGKNKMWSFTLGYNF